MTDKTILIHFISGILINTGLLVHVRHVRHAVIYRKDSQLGRLSERGR